MSRLQRSAVVLLALALAACATSPTGRSQVITFSDARMDAMGREAFEQLKTEEPLSTDPQANAYVTCIAKAITDVIPADYPQQEWEVRVFQSDAPNAFALPGAKIGVYTGILPLAESQDQLATVLGHEVAHVLARHGAERATQSTGINIIRSVAGSYNETLGAALGLGAQYGILLPYSRSHETEADVFGLKLMARAGFDPRASVGFWQNMASLGGERPPEWASTHPASETRIEDLRAEIPEALPLYRSAQAAGRRPNCQR